MKGKSWGIAVFVVLISGAIVYFLFNPGDRPPPMTTAITGAPPTIPPPPAQPAPTPRAPEPPPIIHPIEAIPSEDPLPGLGQSDAPFHKALGEVFGKKGIALILSDELIHHIVVTVDNLPRKHLSADVVPLKRAEGAFIPDGKAETLAIGARNTTRYAAYTAVAQAIDSVKLVALYRRFYPLFQRAYAEIGYPQANFNDRLVVAIDDLLAAPNPEPPISLFQPKILYEYADPDLEARSAGQKIMMRTGRDNAAVLKGKLREIRQLVAHKPIQGRSQE